MSVCRKREKFCHELSELWGPFEACERESENVWRHREQAEICLHSGNSFVSSSLSLILPLSLPPSFSLSLPFLKDTHRKIRDDGKKAGQ